MHLPIYFKRSTLSLAILSTLSLPILAEDNVSNVTRLETVEVLGEAYRNTATKTVLSPQETPQAITIIERDEIEERGASSVTEAMRYAPGVHTELRGGSVTRMDLFNIRGFDNYNNFYDGLTLPFNGWNLQVQIDPIAIERVEVFKGPTSVLYGNMPPGGMVNIIAKAPQEESAHSVNVTTGTDNLHRVSFDSTGQIGDSNANYRIVGLASQKDGQAVTSEEERYVIAPSIDWQVSDSTLLNVNLYYQNDPSAGIFNTVPAAGSVNPNPHGKLSSDAFIGDKNWNTYEREVLLVGYKLLHDVDSSWQFLQNFRYMDASAYQENTYSGALQADNRTLAFNAYLTDETSQAFVVDNQFSGYVMTGEVEHNLLFGVDYQELKSDVVYKDTSLNPYTQDIFNPNHTIIDRNNINFIYASKEKIKNKQLGLYVQNQMAYEDWMVIAGARWDDYESRNVSDRVYSGAPSVVNGEVDANQVSYRLGALYAFDDGLSPYLSYSESFEPVSGADAAGNKFEPSTGQQWESGVKYVSDSLFANLGLFHITKKNEILTDPNNPYGQKYQAGEVVSKGIEVDTRWQATERLDVTANYTRIDMEITEDKYYQQTGKTPVWVPEQMASLWTGYRFIDGMLNGLKTSVGARYVGEAQLNAKNEGKVPDYTLLDMSMRYDLGEASAEFKGMSVTFSATNLLDEEYYSCFDENNCWFGAQRSMELGVKYEF